MAGFDYSNETGVSVDGRELASLLPGELDTPAFLYHAATLDRNLAAWQRAFPDPHLTAVSVKANNNLHLVRRLVGHGAGVTAVSGGEVELAELAGCPGERTVLNGNGKTLADLDAALGRGALITIDAEFDPGRITERAEALETGADCLIRVNPEVDAGVHPYLSTALKESKFGIRLDALDSVIRECADSPRIDLRGLHFHLGSTLEDLSPVEQALEQVLPRFQAVREHFAGADVLDIGGGLGIDYRHSGSELPRPGDLAELVLPRAEAEGLRVIAEPGRSVFGDAGVLLTRTVGVKRVPGKSFLVMDASMATNPRPALYDAFHLIAPLTPRDGEPESFDVVGPVCESADVLGEDRAMPPPEPGDLICMFDSGAYCMSMASSYNLRMPPAEHLLEDGELTRIREAGEVRDLLAKFPGPAD